MPAIIAESSGRPGWASPAGRSPGRQMLRRITAAAARGRQAIDRSGLPEPGAVALTEVPVPTLPGLLQPPQVLRTELDREPLDIIGVVTPATHRHLSERLGATELATTERHRAIIAGRGQGDTRPGHAVWGWSCRSGLRARTGLDRALSAPGLTGPAAAEGAGAHLGPDVARALPQLLGERCI